MPVEVSLFKTRCIQRIEVTARNVDITVKGTAFNVDAASQDIEVALIRGLVAVKDNRKKNSKEVLLQSNQKIVVRDGHILSSDSNSVVRDLVQENDTTQFGYGAVTGYDGYYKLSGKAFQDTRLFSLSFVYRFGGYKEKDRKEVDTSRFGGL